MNPFELINTERFRGSPFSVPCPHCGSVATYKEDRTKTYPTNASSVAFDAGSDADVYSGTVFGECSCTSQNCQEHVHFIGSYHIERDDSSEPPGYVQKFIINCFFPPVPLIKVPPKTPTNVASWLKRSFAPAFNDQSASGHLLRTAIENLLTELKVPRFETSKKGKRRRLFLSERIERLPQTLQAYKDRLLAIRFIGNAASHEDLNVKRLRMLFEIVENLLEDLYGTKRRELLREVGRILRRKKR